MHKVFVHSDTCSKTCQRHVPIVRFAQIFSILHIKFPTLKPLIQHLSQSLGEDQHRVNAMLEALADVLRSSATGLTALAIPSFGTFEPVKYDEEIVTDRVTGKRMLLPPQVTVEFHPAAMLRKRLNESHE